MKNQKWKNRLLCAGLSMAMLVSPIAGFPGNMGQKALAADPTSAAKVGEDIESAASGGAQALRAPVPAPAGESVNYMTIVTHDYGVIKAVLEDDQNWHVVLDGDVEKSVGSIKHTRFGAEGMACMISVDILTLGLMEILWQDEGESGHERDEWAPYYVDEEGRTRYATATPEYMITLGQGHKILELDGHDFTVENPDVYNPKSTLFQVNEGTDFIIRDDKDKGEVFYDGYIFDSSDYEHFRYENGGDMQRDVIEVNGGSFTLNGGVVYAGRSKNESGFVTINSQKKGNSVVSVANGYTGSASKYVNGTAITLKSGEVTINKGVVEGRGFEKIDTNSGTSGGHTRNGAIEAKSGTLTINDGYVRGKGSADCLQVSRFVNVTVKMGKFSVHRNDAVLCTKTSAMALIDAEPTYGHVGIPENAMAARTWVEYNSNYKSGRDMLGSSNWREEFAKDVEGHHAKGDYEPWICVYPDGGLGSLNALANPDPEIPELDPLKDDQLRFQYNLESAFSFLPEEVKKNSGWERTYEFYIYDNYGNQLKFDSKHKTFTEKFGKKAYNESYTLEIDPSSYLVSNYLSKDLYRGDAYYLVCVMTETYYGERTYSATTMAGKQFKCKNLFKPAMYLKPETEKKVSRKGEIITLTAGVVHANEIKWYKSTPAEPNVEISAEDYTIEVVKKENGVAYVETTLTAEADQEATYYCVCSNTIGSVRGSCKVTLPVSFLYTEPTSVKIYQKYGGEIAQPVVGTLEPGMYYQWYYLFWKVEQIPALGGCANGNRLTVPANSADLASASANGVLAFFCEILQKVGDETVTIATSPVISVEYVDDDPPERSITDLKIGGLAQQAYVGQKAPTAEQIYLMDDNGAKDPRACVDSLTITGVNDEGIFVTSTPKITIRFTTTAPYFNFKGTRESGNYEDPYLIHYVAGPYIYGYAKTGKLTSYVDVVIDFDGSEGHSKLPRVEDTLLKGFDTFDLIKDEYVDIPLNVDLEMSDFSLSLGEKHYIKSMSAETYSLGSNRPTLPRGLELVQTGTRINAYGMTEPVYHLRGTVTHTTTPKTRIASITVSIGGVDGYPNGRPQGVSFKYNVLVERNMTDDEVAETANNEMIEIAKNHVHSMSAWTHVPNTNVHQRICSSCGIVEQEAHDFYDVEVIKEATATTPGKKQVKCVVCGYETQRSYSLSPEGHVLTLDLNLGDGYGNQTKDVDVQEGDFVLPNLKFDHPEGLAFDGWKVISKDGQVIYENAQANAAIYVDRDMICKAIWNNGIEDENLIIAKKSLTLYDTIAIDFKIPKESIEGKYHDPYLTVTQNGVTEKITSWRYSDDKTLLVFSYRVAPNKLRDVVTAVPHALNTDGKVMTGPSLEYSATDYCYNMLDKTAEQAAAYKTFRRLLVDILLYGDAAQVYANYKPTELASWKLTNAQRAEGTDVTAAMAYTSVKKADYETVSVADEKANIANAALFLEAAVNIQFKFTANSLDGLRVVVTDGTEVIAEYVPDPSVKDDKDRFYVTFGGLNAAQMRKTVYATVMEGDKKVSNTYRYSIESYVDSMKGRQIPNLDELLDAMMRYGDSASDFVAGR